MMALELPDTKWRGIFSPDPTLPKPASRAMSLVAAGLTAAAGTGLVSGVITRALTRIVVVLNPRASSRACRTDDDRVLGGSARRW
jgi:hypothetical protein